MIYIIGHKNPDTDSICSAISYSFFLRKKGRKDVEPKRAGKINSETKFVLKKFNLPSPSLLKNSTGKKLILVDHNEKEQMVDGEGEIIEVLDHHKINFKNDKPIEFCVRPVGATATIIAEKFFQEGIKIPRSIAGILLSSILSDTVIFRSPTTTEEDREVAYQLNKKLGYDLEEFGKEIKKAGMEFKGKMEDLILRDFKEYVFSGKKFGIAQIEVIDIGEFLKNKERKILEGMREIKNKKNFYSLLFMITDILKQGTELFIVGGEDEISKIFGVEFKNNHCWIDGMMSRKKQVVPPLEKFLKK